MWYWPFGNLFSVGQSNSNDMFPAWLKWTIFGVAVVGGAIVFKKVADKYV